MTKIDPLWRDFLIVRMLNDPQNIDIVEEIIALLLNEPLANVRGKVKVLNRKPEIRRVDDSQKETDFVCDYDGIKINIEFNVKLYEKVLRRNLVYVSTYNAQQYLSKQKKIKDTIQFLFCVQSFNKCHLMEEYPNVSNGKILKNGLRIVVIDLAKVKNMRYTECGRLEKFCQALQTKSLEELKYWIGGVFELMTTEEKLLAKMSSIYEEVTEENYYERAIIENQIAKTIDYLESEAEETINAHKDEWFKDGEAKGRAEGEAKGRVEGESRKQEEIARAMLKDKIDKNIIAKYTQLPLSKIMLL